MRTKPSYVLGPQRGGTVNRPLLETVYSRRPSYHIGCNTTQPALRGPVPQVQTQRRQHPGINLSLDTRLLAKCGPTADLVLSSPGRGTAPSGYGSSGIQGATPGLTSRSQAHGSLMPSGADPHVSQVTVLP